MTGAAARRAPAAAPAGTARHHLVHVFPTFVVGGVQHRIIRVAQALREKYHHTVIALDGNFEAADGLENDCTFAFETLPVKKSAFLNLGNIRRARQALRRLRPDILLTYNWGAIEWTLANRAPQLCRHIHLESGFGPEESPQHQLWRRAQTRRLLLAKCERIVVPSHVLQDLATRVWRLPAAKVVYLPNGIDCGRFARDADAELAASLGIAGADAVIGTVAALRREKNLHRLLRAFAAVPLGLAAKLLIVGDGPERAALTQAAAALGIADRTIFAGAMREPERLLRRFDLFALTSDTEQMPNSVLEAMAAGLAVAATDVGDVRRMLAPENGDYVVPVADDAGLAERFRRLIEDRAARASIGRANQARVRQEYGVETMVARYDALFEGRPRA